LPFENLFDCLKCQALYYDTHTCPPMIIRRKRPGGSLAGFMDWPQRTD
jgi:hypothetical protein